MNFIGCVGSFLIILLIPLALLSGCTTVESIDYRDKCSDVVGCEKYKCLSEASASDTGIVHSWQAAILYEERYQSCLMEKQNDR